MTQPHRIALAFFRCLDDAQRNHLLEDFFRLNTGFRTGRSKGIAHQANGIVVEILRISDELPNRHSSAPNDDSTASGAPDKPR